MTTSGTPAAQADNGATGKRFTVRPFAANYEIYDNKLKAGFGVYVSERIAQIVADLWNEHSANATPRR